MSSSSSEIQITIISDTHHLHRALDPLPGGDLLIHCGDFSVASRSWAEIQDFAAWFRSQPYRYKILIFGNHEFLFEADPRKSSVFGDDVHVLHGTATVVNGLTIYGSPVTPLYGGAFGLSSPTDRKRHWDQIPSGTDILITHGPPFGILDRVKETEHHHGDPELLEAVNRVKPRIHCFGHLHGASGTVQHGSTTFVNAAVIGVSERLEARATHMRFSLLPVHEAVSAVLATGDEQIA